MECLVAIVTKISEGTFAPVASEFSNIYHYKRNVNNLKSQILRLKGENERLQHSVDEAGKNGEEIEGAVEEWMNGVTGIIEKANDEFFRDEDYAKPLCSSKLFPNLVSRRRLSKIANSLAEAAGTEMQRANTLFQKVSYRVAPQSAAIDMTKGGYMIFQSRTSTFNRIMEALRNPDVKMIGVYGMGGVGKTMLAKEVARKAVEDDKLFKKVVIVAVSQTPDPHKIQKEIADQLGLKFGDNEDDKNVRAKRLRQQLGREEKMLLVIDDIWEKLELYEVGIAFGNDSKNDSKILLTSRSLDVVCNDMDAAMNFPIDDLPSDEAKAMFDKIVGDKSIQNKDIQALATEIVKECGGLPIAIATVASALKKKAYPIWSNALQELRTSAPTNIQGMNKKVYSSIKLSYDFLESNEAKSLLLILGIYSGDSGLEIEDLLRCAMGLEPFQSITNLEDGRNKVLTLIDKLKASSLLLNADSVRRVKMHDVVRDVVILIGSEKHNMLCLRNAAELENSKKLKVATAISLPNFEDDAHQLPKSLECPQLEFFYVHNRSFHKNPNLQIPNHFFEAMKELKVLDLTSVCLKPLPSSFEFLKNLHTLFLNSCEIEDVALIGELRNLKILDLAYSKISNFPGQIGQLTRLQLLNLSCCSMLEVIECNVISNLVHLEELYMLGSFTRWDIQGDHSGRRNASLVELKNLSRLTTLHLHIPDVHVMPKGLFTVNLKRYDILIGEGPRYLDYSFDSRRPTSRKLELIELNISRLPECHGLEALLKRSEVLNLYGSTGLNNVIHELDREGFPELKHLKIVNNDEMQYIINSMDQRYHSQNAFFPSLESLHLENLKKLERIWHGELLINSFGKLRVARVKDCERLNNLLSSSSVRDIEEIKVINCKMMSEIATYGMEDDHPYRILAKIEFPHLRSLILKSSPNLAHFPFSKLEATFTGHRKEEEPLLDVNRPLPFFYPMVALPSLKDLELSTLNSEKLLPDHPPENFNMQNLTNLKIHGCNSLKYLLSFDMARNIVRLQHLEVRGCSVMEDVLAINDKERMVKEELLPNLKFLVLDDLPNLKRFCSKSWAEFSSLARLRITNCPKLKIEDSIRKLPRLNILILKRIMVAQEAMWNCQYEIDHEGLNEDDQEQAGMFPCLKLLILIELTDRLMDSWKKNYHPAGRAFQNLKHLFVVKCHTLKNLVPASISFQALRCLVVSECHGMEYLFTPSAVKSLTQLREMMIGKCERMIQIIADYNGSETEEGTEIVFDRLEELRLSNLQNLGSFYSGNCVMRFPNLQRLIFKYCPQMVSFCEGNISAPKLKKLILSIKEDGGEDEDEDKAHEEISTEIMENDIDLDDDRELHFDNDEFSSYPMQKLVEGDINAATRKLWLNNQG